MRVLIFTLLLSVLSTSVFATQDKKTVQLRLQSTSTGQLDQATIYFDHAINPGYIYLEDAQKVFSGVAGVPVLWSLTANQVECSINGIGTLSNTEVVELGADVDVTGTYNIVPLQLDNFDPSSIIRLEDKATGTFHDLRSGAYSATIDANEPTTGRFYIHVSTPISLSTTNAGCADNDGTVSAGFDNSITWTLCNLYDMSNNLMGTYSNVNSTSQFSALPSGDYYVLLNYNGYTVTRNLHVNGTIVSAGIGASTFIAETGQEIDFHAQTTHANQFEWDFGDGTMILGVANPTVAYYEPGVYTVMMKASNSYGCADNSSVSVIINEATTTSIKEATSNSDVEIFASEKTVTIETEMTVENAVVTIYSLNGRPVYTGVVDEEEEKIDLNNVSTGVYIVVVEGTNGREVKKVMLTN